MTFWIDTKHIKCVTGQIASRNIMLMQHYVQEMVSLKLKLLPFCISQQNVLLTLHGSLICKMQATINVTWISFNEFVWYSLATNGAIQICIVLYCIVMCMHSGEWCRHSASLNGHVKRKEGRFETCKLVHPSNLQLHADQDTFTIVGNVHWRQKYSRIISKQYLRFCRFSDCFISFL